jgi:parallel beta-helix repeat protein
MKPKISFVILVFLLALSLFFVNYSFYVKSESGGIYVNSDYFGSSDGSADKPYKTIQEAIDIANAGDTIYIFGGLYKEDIVINKKIKLWGSIDEVETIIDSRFDVRYVLEVTADEVELEGLTVSDADDKTSSPIGALICLKSDNNKIINNFVDDTNSYGIYIDSSSKDNLISGNTINNTKQGIYLYSSSTNDIVNNKITNCSDSGIYVDSALINNRFYKNYIDKCRTGIYVKSGSFVNVTNNYISNNTYQGLSLNNADANIVRDNYFYANLFSGAYLRSSSCTVSNNTFESNQRGLTIASSNNIIKNNRFYNSTASGIYSESSSKNNKIYLNDFKENAVSAKDFGLNLWYYEEQGNYWSDYNYIDLDLDGIGDSPYIISSKNQDAFPLGYFLKPPKKPDTPSPEDYETGVGLRITLQVSVEDLDSDELTVYFYKEDGTLISGTTQNPVKRVKNKGVASFSFTLGFNTTFAWYAVVSDGILENQSDPFIFYTRLTPPDNTPPVAKAGGPYYAKTNQMITFNSTGSYDPDTDGKIDFYRWNFGDGSSEIIRENPTYAYTTEGEYTVTLTVIDNNGASKSVTTKVYITDGENMPPVANAVIPSSGVVGENIVFSSQGTTNPDGDTLSYFWDFGDGTNSTSKNPTHVYQSTGKYLVSLEVLDTQFSDTFSGFITINKPVEETPGFEVLLFVLGLFLILFVKKYNKKD